MNLQAAGEARARGIIQAALRYGALASLLGLAPLPAAHADDELDAQFRKPAPTEESATGQADGAAPESGQSTDEDKDDDAPLDTIPVGEDEAPPAVPRRPFPPAQRVDEIIVTAQKRQQAILDVPMSISAVTGETLEQMGASGAKDIALATPSFSASETGPGNQRFQMRGISTAVAGTRATVGFYLDDIALTALPGFQIDADVYDLQRAEVLRGPQGTLYGEGSMGGTLKLITNPPDFEAVTIDGRALYYDTSAADTSLEAFSAINLPLLDDRLAARVVYSHVDQGGFIDQVELDIPDANFARKDRGRLKLRWEPSDRWQIDTTVLHQDTRSGSLSYGDDNYEREDKTEPGSEDAATIYSLSLNRALSWADALLVYTHLDRDGLFRTDGRRQAGADARLTGFPAIDDILSELGLAAIDEVPIQTEVGSRVDMMELRLNSSADGRWYWVGGLYFRDARESYAPLVQIQTKGLPPVTLVDTQQVTDGRQMSVFGQIEYDLLSWLNIAIGVRHFVEEGESSTSGTVAEQDASSHDDLSFKTTNPRLVLSLRGLENWGGFVDQALAYASISKGFRSGGANIRIGGDDDNENNVFEPDFLWTYELGGKMVLWDGLLTTELAVFFNDWRNVQLTTNVDGAFLTTNSGNSEGLGVDWNFVLRPLSGLQLGFSGNVLDAKFVTTTADKMPGDPVDFVPPRSASAFASYTFNWTRNIGGLARLDWNYQAANRFLVRSAGIDTTSDPMEIVNARLGFEWPGCQVYLFGRNLTDFDGVVVDEGQFATVRTRPRNVGIEVKLEL